MQRMKRVVSLFLVLVMVLSLLPVGIVHAAEDKYPYVIFAENGVTLTATGLTVNGDIATNGVFLADAEHKNVQVEVKSDASGLIMLHDKLMTNYFTAGCVQYGGDYLYDEMNANINESMYVSGSAVFGGNVALNSKLGAASNINITAGVLNANNAVLYSKTGNIELGGSQVSVSGLIYAPNGAVRINTDNFNLNGIIIAKEVEINCTSWSNINYSHSVAELIGKGSTGSEDSGDTGDKEDEEDIIIDWNEAPDTDGDGLPDAYELEKGLNPNVADTDGDGLSDGYESLYAFTNPLEKDGDGNGIIDAEEDFDNDGLTDYEESLYNTYAIIADSDGDGLDDGEEIAYGTNPLIQDTDSDGVDDKTEIALGTDPTKADSDGDGIADGAEQLEQILDYEAETESAVKKVTVSFEAVGSDGGAGSIKNEKDNDRLSTNVVGLIGDPFEITLPDSADSASITFELNRAELGETEPEDIIFLWYDELRHKYVEIEPAYDAESDTVSIDAAQSGRYMLTDEKKWDAAWAEELIYYTPISLFGFYDITYNTVLIIDSSAKMHEWDMIKYGEYKDYYGAREKLCARIDAAEWFIAGMEPQDEAAIVLCGNNTRLVADMTNDTSLLERAVQAVDISGKGDYDTALTLAIDEFDAAMEDYSFTKNRIILMSADMDSWISDEVMDLAVEKSIPVHTIGLGEGEFWTLRDISAYTGGTFTKVYTSDELTGKMRIFNERTEQFDTTDLDEDGLFDAIEERGIRLQTGEIIYTDPENPDTDYDGLLDGEEIDPAYQWEEFEDMETIWEHDAVGEYYFEMYSNPAMPDSDGDGLDDFLEYYNGTNAFLEDTDGDELSDKYEVDKGYDPLRGDSDGDFKSDYQEDKDGTNPFAYDESLFDFMLGMIQGDFIREPQGAVTVAGQVVGGFIPGMDFRDVWANLKHGDLSMAALSVAGLVPGIGDVAKSADTIIKFIVKNADNVDEVVKLLKIVGSNWDNVAKFLGKSDEFKTVMKGMLTNPDIKFTKGQFDDLMDLLKKADLEELADEATNPYVRRFLDENGTSAKGLIGNDFENYLSKTIGGEGSFSVGGRDFDGGIGKRWWEAKSGNYWDMLESNPSKLAKFKSDMGDRLRIATENGATYELFSNTPIPESIKQWLTKKGIFFTEILD